MEGKNTKRKETFQCHYCDMFFRNKGKFNKHIRHCSGCPGFIYSFQDKDVECYGNYLKHEKDFPFTMVGDLKPTAGYILEIEGGSVFVTSYCLMFSFHPKLEMTPGKEEKINFHNKAICNSFLDEYCRCYLCEFPLETMVLNSPDKPT